MRIRADAAQQQVWSTCFCFPNFINSSANSSLTMMNEYKCKRDTFGNYWIHTLSHSNTLAIHANSLWSNNLRDADEGPTWVSFEGLVGCAWRNQILLNPPFITQLIGNVVNVGNEWVIACACKRTSMMIGVWRWRMDMGTEAQVKENHLDSRQNTLSSQYSF